MLKYFNQLHFAFWLEWDEERFCGLKCWKLRAKAKLVCQRQKILPERANVTLILHLCKLDSDLDIKLGEKQI